MIKKIFITAVFFVVCSCKDSSSKISHIIESACSEEQSSCIVSFNSFNIEDWDYVLITNESFSLEDLNKELGFDYPYFTDIGKRIIFVKGNFVVYHEDDFPDPEKIRDGEIIFDMENSNFLRIEKKNAIFKVTKRNNYYFLTRSPIKL